jgi:hypothetical protein
MKSVGEISSSPPVYAALKLTNKENYSWKTSPAVSSKRLVYDSEANVPHMVQTANTVDAVIALLL